MRDAMKSLLRKKDMTKGYTLIEFAIVIAVVGLFVTSFSHFYKIYLTQQRYEKTVDAQRKVNWAISSYLVQNGRYPCPARLDAEREDPDYGMAGECEAGKPGYTALAPGQCGNGICIEESGRTGIVSKVRRGAVPFRTLALQEQFAMDGYNMRLQYAVTEELAVSDTYDKRRGAIEVLDASNVSILGGDAAAGAHYVVFSSGEDRLGAYSRYGKLYQPCSTTSDSENCNTGTSGNAKKAVYKAASTSKAAGSGYYDDMMQFSTAAETPLWRVADEDGRHLNDMLDADTDQVSIGSETPPTDEDVKLDVAGNMKVSDKVRTDNIAQSSGTDGFNPKIVADEDGDLTCPSGSVLSFEAGHAVCGTPNAVKCKDSEMITGIDAEGNVQCASYISCPSKTESGCNGDTFVIPPGVRKQKVSPYTVDTPTVFYKPVYVCSADGTWVKDASSVGSCDVCVPSNTTFQVSCTARKGGNWSGSVTINRVVTCPGNITKDTVIGTPEAAACSCANKTEQRTTNCPGNNLLERREQRQWTCSSPTKGTWSNWTVLNGGACVPPANCQSKEYQNQGCPAGYTGTWQQSRNRNCAAGTVTAWSPTSPPNGSCKCEQGKKETMQKGCVAPLVGTVYLERTLNCSPGPTWSSWKEKSSTCAMKTLRWERGGTISPGKSGPLAGSSCSKAGGTSPCHEPIGSKYQTFTGCICQ